MSIGFEREARPPERIVRAASDDAFGLPSDIARASADRRQVQHGRNENRDGGNGSSRRGARKKSGNQKSELLESDRHNIRRKKGTIAVVLFAVSTLSLFVDSGYAQFFNPSDVFTSYALWFQQTFEQLAHPSNALSGNELLALQPDYFRIINRVGVTLMTVLCGAVLAIAGSLYQSAFRNPIASPSMLGVASAVQLGDVIMILLFNGLAAANLGWRYLVCYLCVAAVMLCLFVFARLMTGRGRSLNVVNLLLVATILNQLIGVVVTYATMYLFDLEMWNAFVNLSEALVLDLSPVSWGALSATCAFGLIPIVLLRFRLNGLNFDDTEMRLLGIDGTKLRLVALLCGTVLLMGAQVQMGTVAMLALVVPHVSRMVFGAEFRKQFWGNLLMGAALLTLCRCVVGLIPEYGSIIPVSTVLNFIVLPFFVWMLATQQREWE